MAQARQSMVAGAGHRVMEEVAGLGLLKVVEQDHGLKVVMVQLMEEGVVVAITEVEGAAFLIGLLVEEVVVLDMLVAVRTLEVPRFCKAPRGPAPVQCCPRRPLLLAMWLGWAWAQRGRTRRPYL